MAERTPVDRTQADKFSQYVVALESYLEQVVDDAQRRPDAALWNARRAAEALCGAILLREENKDPWNDEAQLKVLVNRVTKRHDELDAWLPNLVHHGNRGAHVRTWATESPPWDECRTAVSSLAKITKWFVATAPKEWGLDRELADRLAARAEQLRRLGDQWKPAGRRILSGEIEAEREQLARQLKKERDDRQRLEIELRESAAAREAEAASLRAANTTLEARVAESSEALREARRSRGAGPPSVAHRPRVWLLTSMMIAGMVLGGVGVGLLHRQNARGDAATPSQQSAVSTAASTAAIAVPMVSASASSSADAVPQPAVAASASGVASCPAETIFIGAGKLTFKQPYPRPNWPAAQKPLVEADLPSFCIDVRPVWASEYSRCVTSGSCPKPARSCNPTSANLPMNCVEHDEAVAYCKWARSDLPRVVEWEHALRMTSSLQFAPETGEWATDPFPSPDLLRGEPQVENGKVLHMWLSRSPTKSSGLEPRLSWNKARDQRPDLSFRCVRR